MRLKTRAQVKQDRNSVLSRSILGNELANFGVSHTAVEPNRIRIFLYDGSSLREAAEALWPGRDRFLVETPQLSRYRTILGTVDGVAVDLIGATS